MQVAKLLDYAANPKKRGDILDFSDGNWVDDVGDIGDAVGVYYPPAAATRMAAQYTDEGMKFTDDFLHNPGKATQEVVDGDRLSGNLIVDATNLGIAAGESVVNETVGKLFGFHW
jgi:hypothetical protein